MTDKEIIIDGVNVAGCRYLFDDTAYKHSKTTCSITLKDCKYLGNNCYYKQLQRETQECEELKNNLFIANSNHEAAEKECDRYRQALQKIEEILTYYAISTLGDLQPDGTYKYIFGKSLINGGQCIHYDPRKAQEGLKIINEVKDV